MGFFSPDALLDANLPIHLGLELVILKAQAHEFTVPMERSWFQCLAQGHLDMWTEESGDRTTNTDHLTTCSTALLLEGVMVFIVQCERSIRYYSGFIIYDYLYFLYFLYLSCQLITTWW